MAGHRFSGHPGAWCFDCGAEDKREICCADHDVAFYCIEGHWLPDGCDHEPAVCHEHINLDCPEPGSNRHNPYARKEKL